MTTTNPDIIEAGEYTSVTIVRYRTGFVEIDPDSILTDDVIRQLIQNVCDQLNGIIWERGCQVPLKRTSSPHAFDELKSIATDGVAAEVRDLLISHDIVQSDRNVFRTRYNAHIKRLTDWGEGFRDAPLRADPTARTVAPDDSNTFTGPVDYDQLPIQGPFHTCLLYTSPSPRD